MADENVIGGVAVGVTADLTQYQADLARAQGQAQTFDAAASASFANVGRAAQTMAAAGGSAFSQLSAGQQTLVKSMIAANATAAEASKVFGKTAESTLMLKAMEEQLAAASVKAAAGQAELASASGAAGAAAVEAAVGIKAAEAATQGLHIQTATLTRELLVLGREALRGNFTRMAGSATILGGALGLLTPAMIGFTAAAAASVGALAAAAVAAIQYSEAQKQLLITSVGLGAASGQTAQQLEDEAQSVASSSATSIQAARSSAEAFADAGMTSGAAISQLSGQVGEFAALTQQKTPAALKELAEAMADPAKGAVELNKQLGLLDSSQLAAIRSALEMGDKEKADEIIIKALSERTDQASTATGGLIGWFGKAKAAAGDYWDELGKVVGMLGTMLSLVSALDGRGVPSVGGGGPSDDQKQAAAAAAARRAALVKQETGADDLVAETPEAKAAKQRSDLQAQISQLEQAAGAAKQLGDTAQYEKLTASVGDYKNALSGLRTEVEKKLAVDKLDVQIKEAQHAHNRQLVQDLTTQKALVASGGTIESRADQLALAQGAGSVAGASGGRGPKPKKDTFTPQVQSVEVDTQGEIALASAYLESDAAAIKAEASRKALTETTRAGRTEAQKAAEVQAQINLAVATDAANGSKQAATMAAEAAAQIKANDAVASGAMSRQEADRAMKLELEQRPLIASSLLAEGPARAAATAAIKAQAAAEAELNNQADRAKAIDDVQKQKDELEIAKLQLSLVGATTKERDVAIAKAKEAQSLGVSATNPASPDQAKAIQGAGDLAGAQADLKGAQQMKEMTGQVAAETAAFQKLAATTGMTIEAADKYNELQKLMAEAKKDGIALDTTEIAALDKLATGYARAAAASKQLTDSQKAIVTATNSLADTFESSIEGMMFGPHGTNAFKKELADLAETLSKEALKGVLTGQGPFAGLEGTSQTKTVGGVNGGVLNQLFGSALGAPGASPGNLLGGKGPTGTAMDPIYTTQSAAGGGLGSILGGSGSSNPLSSMLGPAGVGTGAPNAGGGGGILSQLMSMLGGAGSAIGGAASSAGSGLMSLVASLHTGTNYVGTPSRMVPANPALFVNAPRLHTGLAPDEFPAILQRGEGVTMRGGGQPRASSTTVNMNIHGIHDTGGFQRNTHQVARQMRRAMS